MDSWIQRITNAELRLSKQNELLNAIKERQMQYLAHVLIGDRYKLLRLITEGRVHGKRPVGKRQKQV